MDVLIRKAKKGDLSECFELLKTKELLDPNGKPCKKWWISAFLKQIFFVAVQDKKIVGLIIGEIATGKLAILHLMVVKKEFRRKGIASLLFKKAEKEIKKRKGRAIVGYVNDNKAILNFIKKFHYLKGARTYEFLKFI